MLSVYRASAGSGKTFNLTKDYIRMLLGEQDENGKWQLSKDKSRHRHTLAITFTNKATEEMKRRIIHQLAVLGNMEPGWQKPSPYENDFLKIFRCTPEELRSAARQALKSLLLEFNRFNVSTIDSFFQMVLRAFAREAELVGNYEVELDKKQVINDAVVQLLNSLKQNNPSESRRLTEWLTQLMISRIEDGNSYNIFNRNQSVFSDVVNFISKITDEEFDKRRDDVMDYLSDESRLSRFQQRVSYLSSKIVKDARDACAALASYISSHGYEQNLSKNKMGWLDKWTKENQTKYDAGTVVPQIVDDPAVVFKLKCDPLDPNLNILLSNAAVKVMDCEPCLKVYRDIRKNMYMLGLLERTLRYADELMIRDNMLMLSDTNYILHKIIGDGDAPFVYERIGETIRHFLIDEFQDTSKLQWQNLKILVENGLSEGFDSLIIGDEKQCIYRFRNSDPSLLKEKLKADFPDDYSEVTGAQYNTNWRSTRDVVEFNNRLFSGIAMSTGYGDVYANVKQLIPDKNKDSKGYVQICCGTDKEAVLNNMLSNIQRQLDSGYKPGDIAILVRRAADGKAIVRVLADAGLRVVSDDAVEIGSSPVIRLIVSILRLISTCETEAESRNLTQRELADLFFDFENKINHGMSRSEALQATVTGRLGTGDSVQLENESIKINTDDLKCANLFSTVEEIISSPLMPSDAVETENVFLATFQDMVLDFHRRGGGDIVSFLNWWNTQGSKVKVRLPADDAAIRMMTIHKSKGLEFKCVHIPFASWSLFDPKDSQWFEIKGIPGLDNEDTPVIFPLRPQKYMESTALKGTYEKLRREAVLDELNVAYVGFTRAVSELIIGIDKIAENSLGKEVASVLQLSEGQIYETGEPTVPVAKESEPVPALEKKMAVDMPRYEPRPRPDLWSHTVLENEESISDQRKRGLSYHGMLSRIRRLSDIDYAAQRCVSEGSLTSEEAAEHAAKLTKMIMSHGLERWFEGYQKVMCERQMIDADGNEHRPDRVVWLPDESVEVIDYKTGEEKDSTYRRQVRRYMSYLRGIGYSKVRGYLWYIDTDRVTEVR